MNKSYSNKYKKLTKDTSLFSTGLTCSSRVSKFKKSKWKSLKSTLFKIENSKEQFFSLNHVYLKKYTWKRTKSLYKQGVLLKNFLDVYFNKSFSSKFLKKSLGEVNFSKNLFISKLFFRIDVFLWKLNLFSSIRETHQFFFSEKIYLNNIRVKTYCFLKKGDIISFEHCLLTLPNVLYFTFFLSFCEIDYYAKKIIILKNFDELSELDISLIFKNKLELQALIRSFN